MTVLFRAHLCALTACAVLAAQPAAAAFASFDFPHLSARVDGGATIGLASISLPNSGTPGFSITFVLPRDYQPDSEVRIVFYLNGGTAPCKARLVPDLLIRTRIGAVVASDMGGLSGGNPLVSFASVSTLVQKTFTLVPGGEFLVGQKPGDGFFVHFIREADPATDTCTGTVNVYNIDIRYMQAP
jgi:hypothetical protein